MKRKGQIGGEVEREPSELLWLFALFKLRSSLVQGQKCMAGVRATSRASRRSKEWPELPGPVVHSNLQSEYRGER